MLYQNDKDLIRSALLDSSRKAQRIFHSTRRTGGILLRTRICDGGSAGGARGDGLHSSDRCGCCRRRPTRGGGWSAGGAHGDSDGSPSGDRCCGGSRCPTRCGGGSAGRAGTTGPPRRLHPAGRCTGATNYGYPHLISQPGPAGAPLFVRRLRRLVEPGAPHRPLLCPHLLGRGSHRGRRRRLRWSPGGAGHAKPSRRSLYHSPRLTLPPRAGVYVPDGGGVKGPHPAGVP